MITILLLSWFMSIITFLLGFALGKNAFTKQTYEAIKKGVEHRTLKQYKQPSGVIQRPNAQRIYELNNPDILEQKEEMKKSLEAGIEPLTI
jgi:hypothetical protein